MTVIINKTVSIEISGDDCRTLTDALEMARCYIAANTDKGHRLVGHFTFSDRDRIQRFCEKIFDET